MYLTPKAYPKRAFRSVRTATNSSFCLAVLILSAIPVHAQRFVKVVNTVEELARANINDVHTNVFVADPDRGGVFILATRGATNSGTAFASTNATRQWTRQYNGVLEAKWFGSANNGTTDDSSVILAAIATMTNGGTLRIPARTKFSITLTNDNITLIGGGSAKDYASTNAAARFAWLPVGTNWIVRVGDNTRLVKGITIRDATFYNPNNEGTGLYWHTAAEGEMRNITSWGFKDCIVYKPGTAFPCFGIYGYNINVQPGIITGSRGVRLSAIDYSATSYLTAIGITGGHGNGLASGTDTYLMEVDGAHFNLSDFYMDFGSNHGVLIAQRMPNVLTPQVVAFNVNLDAGGGGNVVEVHSSVVNTFPYNKWCGWTRTSGSILMPSAETYAIPEFSTVAPPFFTPNILSGAYFARDSSFTNHGTEYIRASDSGVLTLRGSGGASIGDGILGPVQINSGNIYLDNNRVVSFNSVSGGTPFNAMSLTPGDNLLLSAPTNVILLPLNGLSALYSFGVKAFETEGTTNVVPQGRLKLPALTADRALYLDGNNYVAVSSITPTELGRLTGLGTNLTTHLQLKQDAFTTDKGVTNINNVLSAVIGAGTNVVLTTNGNTIVINTSATLTDTDGYTLLPIVTTTDGTLTPIFTNTVANNSMVVIDAHIDAINSTADEAKHTAIHWIGLNTAGTVANNALSFVSETYVNPGGLADDWAVNRTPASPSANQWTITVQNNSADTTAPVKWQMRYKLTTLAP